MSNGIRLLRVHLESLASLQPNRNDGIRTRTQPVICDTQTALPVELRSENAGLSRAYIGLLNSR